MACHVEHAVDFILIKALVKPKGSNEELRSESLYECFSQLSCLGQKRNIV